MPKRMSNAFVQAGFVMRLHKERVLEECYAVRVQTWSPLPLAKRRTLVQPEERLIIPQLQFVPLFRGRCIRKKNRHVLHTVTVCFGQAVECFVDQFLKVFICDFKHYYT